MPSLAEDDVVQLVNHALFAGTARATTYKFAFFKAILDNLFNMNLSSCILSYDALTLRFTEIYWNLVLRWHLKQMITHETGKMTAVERKLYSLAEEKGIPCGEGCQVFLFENASPSLQAEAAKRIKAEMLKNVVGAFCGDTKDSFYQFDKADKSLDGIIMNPDVYNVLVKYKSSFEKLNYYEWIKYLEKANKEEDSYALAGKLDSSTKRSDLSAYRKILFEFGQSHCFYCGKALSPGDGTTIPVDHFIPWSFIKDDKLWNFVLACPVCNGKKSDTLPAGDFILVIQKRNDRLALFPGEIVERDFKNYTHSRLNEMYGSAVFNGYEVGWTA